MAWLWSAECTEPIVGYGVNNMFRVRAEDIKVEATAVLHTLCKLPGG